MIVLSLDIVVIEQHMNGYGMNTLLLTIYKKSYFISKSVGLWLHPLRFDWGM